MDRERAAIMGKARSKRQRREGKRSQHKHAGLAEQILGLAQEAAAQVGQLVETTLTTMKGTATKHSGAVGTTMKKQARRANG